MSVFRVFQRFFVWVILVPLVAFVVGEPFMSPAFGRSCSSYLYRAYDGRDSVKLYQISYTPGSQLPTEDVDMNTLVAPTHNGYTFNGFYKGSDQFYDSTLTRPGNAPSACVDFSAKWGLVGCDLGVINQIEGEPAVVLTTAGSASVNHLVRPSRWIAQNEPHRLQGFAACSAIPGGYDDSSGYSTASTSDISNGASGDNCWCRLVESNVRLTGNSNWSTSANQPYAMTQWVYAGTVTNCVRTANDCYDTCAQMASSVGNKYDAFRSALYGMNCPFTITYHNISGHTNTALRPTDYTFEKTPVNLPTPSPSVSGEAFLGWYKNSSFTGSAITQITYSDLLATGDQDVYARWGYNVSYNCGSGGSGTPPATHGCAAGQSCTVASTAGSCVKPGDAFQGWACSYGNASSPFTLALGQTFTMPSSAVTCTALWGCSVGYDLEVLYNSSGILKDNVSASESDKFFVPIDGDLDGDAVASQSPLSQQILLPGEWEVRFEYGFVRGSAFCNNSASVPPPANSARGPYCWCIANVYDLNDGGHYHGFPAFWGATAENVGDSCEANCPEVCAKMFSSDDGFGWRRNLYDAGKAQCVTHVYDIGYHNVDEPTNTLYGSNVSWPQNYPVKPDVYTILSPSFAISRPDRSYCYYMDEWCENNALNLNCTWPKVVPFGSTGDKDFYAKWVDKNYTITLDKGAFDVMGWIRFHGDDNIENNDSSLTTSCCGIDSPDIGLPPAWGANNTLTRSGYVFTGWSPSSHVICDATKTITAQWCACSGATCTPGTNVSSCSMAGTVTENACNYNFNCNSGYNYNGSASGGSSATQGSCPAVTSPACSGNILDLVWYRETTGATPLYQNPNPSTCQYGGNMSPLVPPTKPGYTFGGWTVTTQRQ